VARGADTRTNDNSTNGDDDVRPLRRNAGRERLRYNTNKVAAFVRRREQLTVFLEWARKSAQLAMYVKAKTSTYSAAFYLVCLVASAQPVEGS